MHILMVSDVYFPRINGVSTSIQTFRDTLQQLGHRVSLIAPAYGCGEAAAVGIHRLPGKRVPFDPEDRLMSHQQVCRKISELHRSDPFELIHIQTPFIAHRAGKHMARQLDLPCIETYHTHFEEYMHNYVPLVPRQVLRAMVRYFTRRQCNGVNGLITPSSAMQEVIRGYGIRTGMQIIPTGIDPDKFRSGDGQRFRRQHGLTPAQPVLVHIGRIGHEKNIDFLLRVHQQILQTRKDTVLVIAGEGPALEHLKRLSQALGTTSRTRFVGYLDRSSTLLDCYAAGTAFVFASRTETQGLVLLEALALGVPVVSTAVLGTRDILCAERGALIAPENVDQFAELTLRVLQDPALQQHMAQAGRNYVQHWSHQALAQKLLGFYRQILAEYRQPEAVALAES